MKPVRGSGSVSVVIRTVPRGTCCVTDERGMMPVRLGQRTYTIAARALTEEPLHCRSVSSSVALCCMEKSLEKQGPVAERGAHEKTEERIQTKGGEGKAGDSDGARPRQGRVEVGESRRSQAPGQERSPGKAETTNTTGAESGSRVKRRIKVTISFGKG